MRLHIADIPIGEYGSITIHTESGYIYPSFTLEGRKGESAEISLQHTSVKNLHRIADALKAIAFQLSNPAHRD